MARRYAGGATRSRPGGPCRAVWLRVGRLVHRVPRARLTATERAPHPGNVPRTDLPPGFHGTVQSATTWRKTPRVLTSVPSSSRRSSRRCFQHCCPLSSFSGKLYLVPVCACGPTGLLPSSWRGQIAFRCLLTPPRCLHEPARHEPFALFNRTEAERRFRRTHSRGFVHRASSGHTPITAQKGGSFSRVPSLGITFGLILRRVRFALACRTEPSP